MVVVTGGCYLVGSDGWEFSKRCDDRPGFLKALEAATTLLSDKGYIFADESLFPYVAM